MIEKKNICKKNNPIKNICKTKRKPATILISTIISSEIVVDIFSFFFSPAFDRNFPEPNCISVIKWPADEMAFIEKNPKKNLLLDIT